MRAADWIIELGPGAGPAGGRLVAQGTPADVIRNMSSVTEPISSGRHRIPVPRARARPRLQQPELLR